MNRAASILVCALALMLAAAPVDAGERTHRVGAGESASALAKRYYGEFDLAPLLLAYNGKRGTTLRLGETLRIPACPEHVVQSGDSWSVLTGRYLGRPGAWPVVARLNGLDPGEPLHVGQSVVFPVVLPHELRRGETLAVLADRYYGDPRQGSLLQDFNGIEDVRRLAVGQTIDVPLLAFRLAGAVTPPRLAPPEPEPRDEPVDTGSAAEAIPVEAIPPPVPPAPPEPERRFVEPLHEAALDLARGRFEEARDRLDTLRGAVTANGAPLDCAELWRLLLALHVAYDEDQQACEAYRSLADLSVPDPVDPDLVSPKVRETIERCSTR